MRKNIFLTACLITLMHIASATLISVRLIKDRPSSCTKKPGLYFLSFADDYNIMNKQWYNGENDWEIFFEIETRQLPLSPARISIYAPGVNVERALVGRSDVSFLQRKDSVYLQLVNDTADGRHIQTSYQRPGGGPYMWIFHNWEARMNGDYLGKPYPVVALAASLNFALACQEMLRLMGDRSGLRQDFYGEFILLNCESSAPRAHLDFPPHWHLEHWEDAYNNEYGLDWRRKQCIIPHYYLDSAGNIERNKQSITQNNLPEKTGSREFRNGDTCTWKDAEYNLIFKQVIWQGGLDFIKGNGEVWRLQPDPAKGAAYGVWVLQNGSPIAFATALDKGDQGETDLFVDTYREGKITGHWEDIIKFDRFTGIAH